MELKSGFLAARIEDGIGWLIFDKPAKLNALSLDMVTDALAVVLAFAVDPEVKVVVMRGSGRKAFISGADISRFAADRGDAEANRRFQKLPDELRDTLSSMSKPVIAMIHGYCLGGGLALALSADLRFASEDAQFAIPAAKRGVAYPEKGLEKLVELVGPSVAKDIMFSARKLSAAEALRVGLINRIVAADDLEAETAAYARQLVANAPLSIQASKYIINQISLPPHERDRSRIARMIDRAADSADFREATESFLQKREPVFRGI